MGPGPPTPMVRIFAFGSPHGDDQAGWRALELLRDEDLPGVAMEALSVPLELLDHLPNCKGLVLLDACHSGAQPGTVVRLTWPLPANDSPHGTSSHGLGVVEALALAASLGITLPPITILGVEVSACAPGAELSDAGRAALPELCRTALDEARRYLADGIESAKPVDHR